MTLVAFATIASSTVLPVIARDLGGLAEYVWGFSAAVVASLLGIVVSGLVCDSRGPRSGLIVGVVALSVGSALCSVAPSFLLFVGSRFIQGFGGGALMVTAYVIVARAIPDDLRPRAMAALAAAWVVPVFAGAVLAGWVADNLDWRLIYASMPVVAVGILLWVAPHLRYLKGAGAPVGWVCQVASAVLAVVGLLLIQDAAGRLAAVSVPEGIAGVALLLVAIRRLLPRGAMTLRRGLPTSVMMRGILSSGYFASAAFLPLALVELRGATATQAGLVMGIAGLGWWVGSFIQGHMSSPTNTTHLVAGGALLVAGSLMAMASIVVFSVPVWAAALLVGLCEVGLGLSVPASSVQVFRLSSDDRQGFNSSAMQVADTTLTMLLAALLSLVYAAATLSDGIDPRIFAVVWLVAGVPALLGAIVAPRMRPVVTIPRLRPRSSDP
jgi:MFS family permease